MFSPARRSTVFARLEASRSRSYRLVWPWGFDPKAAALGHRDMAVTLGTYAHLLPGAQAAAMNAVGNLMFGPSGTGNVT